MYSGRIVRLPNFEYTSVEEGGDPGMVPNEPLLRNPPTRPAPAGESAGRGPPSPPRGRGKCSRLVTVRFLPSAVRNPSPFTLYPSAFNL